LRFLQGFVRTFVDQRRVYAIRLNRSTRLFFGACHPHSRPSKVYRDGRRVRDAQTHAVHAGAFFFVVVFVEKTVDVAFTTVVFVTGAGVTITVFPASETDEVLYTVVVD